MSPVFSFGPLSTRRPSRPCSLSREGLRGWRGLEHKSCEEWLRDLGVFGLGKGGSGQSSLLSATAWKEGVGSWGRPLLTGNCARSRGNGLELCQGRFRLAMRRHFSSARALRRWDGLPREVVESPSLGVLRERLDVVLGDTVSV